MNDWKVIYKNLTGEDAATAPTLLYDALEVADDRCRRAGGALVSRQAIAAIIAAYELLPDSTEDK